MAAATPAIPSAGLSAPMPESSSPSSEPSSSLLEDAPPVWEGAALLLAEVDELSSSSSSSSSSSLSSRLLMLRVPHLDWMSSLHLGSSTGSPALASVHCLKASWQTRE